jgi:hypothetical protein
LVCPVIVLIALFGSSIFPPPSPAASAEKIAAFYQDNTDLKRAGLLLTFLGFGLIAPLVAVISVQLMRIEGRGPAMAIFQLMAGIGVWVIVLVSFIVLAVAAFRPGRTPEITQTLSDLGYILLIMPVTPFTAQNIAIAVAVLSDHSDSPVYPRWVAWLNLWVGFTFIAGGLVIFFTTGPFSYRGLLAFWIPGAMYFTWIPVMALMTRRAILAQDSPADRTTASALPPMATAA